MIDSVLRVAAVAQNQPAWLMRSSVALLPVVVPWPVPSAVIVRQRQLKCYDLCLEVIHIVSISSLIAHPDRH